MAAVAVTEIGVDEKDPAFVLCRPTHGLYHWISGRHDPNQSILACFLRDHNRYFGQPGDRLFGGVGEGCR